MIKLAKSPSLVLPALVAVMAGCFDLRPAAAQSAAGSAAIQAANDAMNTVISDVAEGTTDAAGVLTGLPVHDAGLGAEIPELNTSLNEETMAAADGVMTSIYNQNGFPIVAPTPFSDAAAAIEPSSLTSVQELTQLRGTIDSGLGTEIATAEKAATAADITDVAQGYERLVAQRAAATRQGIEGDAAQDLSEAEEVDGTLTAEKAAANEIKSLAGGQQMSVQATLLVAKEDNDIRKDMALVVDAASLTEQRRQTEDQDRLADIKATEALFVP